MNNTENKITVNKNKNNNQYEFKEKNKDNKYNSVNDIISNNKNLELEREINQLKNENNYKDYLIEDLRNQIVQKNKKEEKKETINNNEYNNLLKELDKKNMYIEKLENDIKNLKFKIDNLIIENKKIKNENNDLLSQKEELKANSDANKLDFENNLEKLKKLEFMNKKLNKDYLNLSNDFKIIKDEKEKLKSIIDEQNATIFNYEKQLNSKNTIRNNFIKNNNFANERISNYSFNDDRNNNRKDYDINEKYNYSNEDNNKYNYSNEKNNYTFDEKDNNRNYEYNKKNYDYDNNNRQYNNNNTTRTQKKSYLEKYQNEKNYFNYLDDDFKGRKYNYKNDINYNDNNESKYIAEKNKKFKKGELNYLENYLITLLKERTQLENDLSEIPDHPRTLKDIKLKNSIKDKITQNDKEIFNIQKQLKNIRGQ